VAGGFLGVSLAALGAVGVLAVAAAPLILGLLTAGVADRQVAADQMSRGWLLMALTMPQLPLYGAAIIGGAVMNAHGRFALAAAAPVAENLGLMVTMGAVAVLYGTGTSIASVSTGELLLLGLGSSAAVALHAGLMVWGAWRSGARLVPRRGWRLPAVRALLRKMTASLGQTSLTAARFFAMLVVANTVPAGVVAYQMAINFLYLPVQVGGRPISLAMLPSLSRLWDGQRLQAFRDEYGRGTALIWFLTLPAAVAYLVLASALGRAVSFGAMAGTAGPGLVAACLAGLAVAVLGEAGFQQATYASYARHDARSPLVATAAGTVASLICLPAALVVHGGQAVLLAIGLAFSAGSVAEALWLHRRLVRSLPAPGEGIGRALLRTLAASAVMAVPAFLVSAAGARVGGGPVAAVVEVLAAAAVGAAAFLAVQRRWHAPELTFFAGGLRRLRPGSV
jgi:putative peptidoglycan lipid II flippase